MTDDLKARGWRTPAETLAFAAWVNCPPDAIPPEYRQHTCEATMTAWRRVVAALHSPAAISDHPTVKQMLAEAEAAVAVPVAWKYRWKIDGEYVGWRYADASNFHLVLDGYEEQPLYSSPAHGLAMVEALRSAAKGAHENWMGKLDAEAERDRLAAALTEAQATIARLEAERAELAFMGRTLHGWTQHDVLVNHEGAYQAIRTMAGRLAALSPGKGE